MSADVEVLRAAVKTLRTSHTDTFGCVALLQRFLDAREPLADLLDGFADIGGNNTHAIATARAFAGTPS